MVTARWRRRMACRSRGHKLAVVLTGHQDAVLVARRCATSTAVPTVPVGRVAAHLPGADQTLALDSVGSALLLAGAMLQGERLAVTGMHEAAADGQVAVLLARWLLEALGEDRQQRLDGMAALSLREQLRGIE